jgi:hypothetical protein
MGKPDLPDRPVRDYRGGLDGRSQDGHARIALYQHIHPALSRCQQENDVCLAKHLVMLARDATWDAAAFDMDRQVLDLSTGDDTAPDQVARGDCNAADLRSRLWRGVRLGRHPRRSHHVAPSHGRLSVGPRRHVAARKEMTDATKPGGRPGFRPRIEL